MVVNKAEYEQWKESWGPSQNLNNFFSEADIEWLCDVMYKEHYKRRTRRNGTLHFFSDMEKIKTRLYDKVKQNVDWIEDTPWRGNFFITSTPYNLHTDTGTPSAYKDYVPGKQLIIPLFICWTGHRDKPDDWHPECGTALMKNRFIRYGTNFAKDDKKYSTDVNDTLYDYSDLVSYDMHGSKMDVDWNKGIGKETYQKYFTHYNHNWLRGFEIEQVHNWKVGNMIAFDMCQAHSGIDFKKDSVSMKAGLTIMTTRKKRAT